MLRCQFHGCGSKDIVHLSHDQYQCLSCKRIFVVKEEQRKHSNSGFRDRIPKHHKTQHS
ncbi:MAG: hypothetical protein KGN31_08205 [Betaproteobacteria bacterium]|nr:hypothetical protein [Betaproteobacteria bacterium]MDE2424172.1 hypothetical protein [Betaproteobacteria bacterium]